MPRQTTPSQSSSLQIDCSSPLQPAIVCFIALHPGLRFLSIILSDPLRSSSNYRPFLHLALQSVVQDSVKEQRLTLQGGHFVFAKRNLTTASCLNLGAAGGCTSRAGIV